MRSRATAATALCLILAAGAATAQVAHADEDVPSRAEIREAERAVAGAGDDVASVQAALSAAHERLRAAAITAAQAAEAFNGARYEAAQARIAARKAAHAEQVALADQERLRDTYAESVVTSFEAMPELNALSGVMESEGILDVVERVGTMTDTQRALDGKYDDFRVASSAAEVASNLAADARAEAVAAETAAREARDEAQAAADGAAAEAQAVAEEKSALLVRLAELQDISVDLATRRQAGLERAAAQAAAEAAAEAAAQAAAEAAAEQQAEQEQVPAPTPTPAPAPEPTPEPSPEPTPTPEPASEPAPSNDPPPASSGAQAAIAFARDQIGEPYVWGAAGPGSWDCSGLTMAAWQRGGTSLPHYSVAQYDASTPVDAGDLAPGDLLFWGSSSDPSSIYHVALYIGDGQMIHAPRTGQPVQEASMYYWTPPNFFARP